jgi:SAM-dependent MidA family methyltransferase
MKGDPLGVAGDFITSPEISQVFGEVQVSSFKGDRRVD